MNIAVSQLKVNTDTQMDGENGHDVPVALAYGDGIGPEIMKACLKIMIAAGARLDLREVQIGEQAYKSGHLNGMPEEAWDVLRETKIFFKAPITTPQGGGFKSLNVTVRKSLGLFANVRPVKSYAPSVATKHPGMDLVIVRENEEDLYAGIEHRQTDEVYQCLKLITEPGSERICRYAFEYAKAQGRNRITCFTKDNIMKMTDGLFRRVFEEVAKDYPDIQADHMIIDIGAAKVAAHPTDFDMIVMPNLYGDIVSDIAAEVSGSVGLAGSANIGAHGAMFEAVHGSAPDIAGQDIANPSGLLMGGLQMLHHIGQGEVAVRIENAWLKSIEDGLHTADIYQEGVSKEKLGTQAFADAIIARLGDMPSIFPAKLESSAAPAIAVPEAKRKAPQVKELIGVDIFVHGTDMPDMLAEGLINSLHQVDGTDLELSMITNRGVMVWPKGLPETFVTDHWRCRFQVPEGKCTTTQEILALMSQIDAHAIDFIKTENLYTYDGQPGYSKGHGQ